jgi:hypothetical protein
LKDKKGLTIMNATLPARAITRIITLGTHAIEFLEDGSIDIVDLERIGEPKEYTHLEPEEAYRLFSALYEQYKIHNYC